MSKRRLSPFEQLRTAIDNELYDLTLRTAIQISEGEQIDMSFVLGYREALRHMSSIAEAIERRGLAGEQVIEYLTKDEISAKLLERINRERV